MLELFIIDVKLGRIALGVAALGIACEGFDTASEVERRRSASARGRQSNSSLQRPKIRDHLSTDRPFES